MKQLITTVILLFIINLASAQVGSVKWTFDASDDIESCPAIADDGTIYVTDMDAYLYALNADGSLKWKFYAEGDGGSYSAIYASPVIGPDGTIYVVEDLGKVFALNPDSTLKWSSVDVTNGEVKTTPSILPDGSIVISSSVNMVVLDAEDGSVKWQIGNGADYGSPAVDAQGTIIGVHGLRSITDQGELNWKITNGSDVSSPAIGADGTIYIGSDDAKSLFAVNKDGSIKWEYKTGYPVFSSPLIGYDGTIFILSNEVMQAAPLDAVNSDDGTKKWRFEDMIMVDLIATPVIGADSTIYIGGTTATWESKIFAVNTENGSVKWSQSISDVPGQFFTITDDSLLLFTIADELHAMRIASAGLADTPWPKYKKDNKNSGLTTASVTGIEMVDTKLPAEYSLSEAYPNPFNPTTRFRFSVPKSAQVNISVYNALGQLVDNLVNDMKNNGTYEVTWNASSFGSGVYFVRLSSDNGFVQTKKVMLIK